MFCMFVSSAVMSTSSSQPLLSTTGTPYCNTCMSNTRTHTHTPLTHKHTHTYTHTHAHICVHPCYHISLCNSASNACVCKFVNTSVYTFHTLMLYLYALPACSVRDNCSDSLSTRTHSYSQPSTDAYYSSWCVPL